MRTYAAIFVVTSNADSGTGTLREALTLAAANGSAQKDFINFAIPDLSEAGRTITLESELPFVSSNLSIDGSTQPGLIFGKSEAKVKIMPNRATYKVYLHTYVGTGALFLYNVQNVEIYGLFITNFADLIDPYFNNNSSTSSAAIFCSNVTNAIIGAPGRGNVIYNNNWGIEGAPITAWPDYSPADHNSNIVIQSNFIMVDADGKTDDANIIGYFFGVDVEGDDLKVGGDLAAERNYFGACQAVVKAKGNNIQVLNNYGGVDKAGNLVQYQGAPSLVSIQATGSNISIRNNKFSNANINLTGVNNFTISGNNDIIQSGYSNQAISMNNCSNGVIGSEDEADKNIFIANTYSPAIFESQCFNIKVLKNSIYCSVKPYEIQQGNGQGDISVLVNSNIEYSGKATPNSDVYIYEDNSGCEICNPIAFYTKLKADAAGNWKITGDFTNKRWVSNALYLNSSTEFTQPTLSALSNSSIVTNPTCGSANGSIEITQYKNIQNFEWYNFNGAFAGTGPKITGLGSGSYYAKCFNGNCSIRSASFTLNDVQIIVNDQDKNVIQPTCNAAGSITGLTVNNPSGLTYSWKDEYLTEVGTALDITGLTGGNYILIIKDAINHCTVTYGPVAITAAPKPAVINQAHTVKSTPCNQAIGSITGITASGGTAPLKYSWKNSDKVEVGTSADLTGQPAGKYILYVTDAAQCAPVLSEEITIPGVSDATIDISTAVKQDATCSNYDGSIKNVKITGTGLTYSWRNAKNKEMGTKADLMYVPAGKYALTISGGSACTPITSDSIILQGTNAVAFDFSTPPRVLSATCANNNGSVTGIKAPGATKFEWKVFPGGPVIRNTLDLKNVAAGKYTITISNPSCSASADFTVAMLPLVVFPKFEFITTKSCFGFGTGTISLNTDNAPSQPIGYRWVSSAGDTVAYSKVAQFLKTGKYDLYLTDKNGCKNYYDSYTVEGYPQLTIAKYGGITHITCGIGKGSVSETVFAGGTGNYAYQWFNADSVQVGDKPFIDSLAAGKYKLRVTDGGCSKGEITYEILDINQTPPTPVVNDVNLSNAGKAALLVSNPYTTAIYNLYDSPTSVQPIDQQRGGIFTVDVTESRSYYITLTYGVCESERVEVKVILGTVTGGIANTFTPNGDGINDYWNLSGIGNFSSAVVQVFNRYGSVVFQSKGYAQPFNGTHNGKPLPAGVYYYIINLGPQFKPIAGNVTILR